MLELASHILDIAENSIRAGARLVEIIINEDEKENLLFIEKSGRNIISLRRSWILVMQRILLWGRTLVDMNQMI